MKVEERPPAPQPPAEVPPPRVDWAEQARRFGFQLLAPFASLVLAAILGVLVVLVVQRSWGDVADVAGAMWDYGLMNPSSLAFIFGRATPFIFAGLAVAIGPALLKVYRGAHEVISTIMMNYLANGVLLFLLSGALKDPDQVGSIAQQRTAPVDPSAQVGSMVGFFNSLGFSSRSSAPLTWFFLLALVAAVIYLLTVRRTRFGFELRVIGTNPRAAEPAGIRTNAMFMKAMLLSGAVAGLAGLQDVLGIDDFMKLDYVRGYGFIGIAIALLGRNSGLGIVAAALLFAYLDRASSGIGLSTDVPKEVTYILQGVIILTIVIAYELVRRYLARRQLRETHERA